MAIFSSTSECFKAYPNGTPVTLTATADRGSVFDGWSENCPDGDVIMYADETCRAEFRDAQN